MSDSESLRWEFKRYRRDAPLEHIQATIGSEYERTSLRTKRIKVYIEVDPFTYASLCLK